MEELLIAIIQFVLELLLEVLANLPIDWPSRKRSAPESANVAWRCLLWCGGGALLGGLSLLPLPHSLIQLPALRIANLVLAPPLSGALSWWLTQRHSRHNANLLPRYHFWRAFAFTLGLVAVRFAYVS